jgi:SHS family sialic acid transporter-like MFS transporter
MDPLHPWFTTASFLFGFVGTIYFGWLPLFLPELFPTRVRATGAGISFNTGRIVAGFVALATGLLVGLTKLDYARVGLWTGLIYAVGMVIILFTPTEEHAVLKE